MPAVKTTTKKPAPKKTKKVTIDDVWATMRELQELHKENEKEIKEYQAAQKESEKALNKVIAESTQNLNKSLDESTKNLNKSLDESTQNLNRIIAESTQNLNKLLGESTQNLNKLLGESTQNLNKAISGLSNTLGSLVEHIMTPDLPRKFEQFGFTFDQVTTVKWAIQGSIYAEIDGLLENGNQAMVVEVKTTLHNEDIDEHLERMDKVRAYADIRGDKRQFLGAMAAMITSESTRKYALKKGFFVIEPSGEDVKVTQPVSQARVW